MGHFDVKLNQKRSDEIGKLASSINDMSVRLDRLVNGQKRFLGDVAHELASPIARIQLALGILENAVTDEDHSRVEDLREEVQQLAELVDELLSFSRAENAMGRIHLGPVLVAEPVGRAIRRESVPNVDIQVSVDPGICAMADPELLTRAVANILRNGVRYAGSEGPIEVEASTDGTNVTIEIRDSGKGVPENQLAQIFDPFYRVDESRTRSTGGVGLGLAIVKTCIQACKGSVHATNRTPQGFAVTITLASAPSAGAKQHDREISQ